MVYLQHCLVVTWLVQCKTAAISVCAVCTIQPCTTSCHFMLSHTHRMHVCLTVTCHLHFWQNDQDFLFTCYRSNNRYQNKSQHRKVTLEKEILPPLLLGLKPATFWSQVLCSKHWAIPTPRYSQYEKGKWCVQNKVELFSTALFHFQCGWWSSFSALNVYLSLMFLLCHFMVFPFCMCCRTVCCLTKKTTAKKD